MKDQYNSPHIITKTTDLIPFCERLHHQDVIALDTEFWRQTTYYPELCLIQVAQKSGEITLIDPRARDLDLTSFYTFMRTKAVRKILHGAQQDIEIFFLAMGEMPQNVIDTQIMAGLCGLGSPLSYERLVANVLGKRIDKSARLSDWRARPLSPEQSHYAVEDVRHLIPAYDLLWTQIKDQGRGDLLQNKMAGLLDPAIYESDAQTLWRQMRGGSALLASLTGNQRFILRKLIAYREDEAKRLNIPRRWVLTDEQALAWAKGKFTTKEELKRSFDRRSSKLEDFDFSAWFQIGKDAHASRETEALIWPNKEADPSTVKLLATVLEICAREHQIAPTMLVKMKDLEFFAIHGPDGIREDKMDPAVWKIFGQPARDMLAGERILHVENGKVSCIPFKFKGF